jgi:tRNA dimethylallyltransferase
VLPAGTILVAGPSGAGKTDLSVRLAGNLHGEIVGADAFQIYTGLPILTAQPPEAARALIPHHLIGSVDPAEAYDAGRYLREALPIIRDIAARGKRPLVVGGSGLYFRALLGGLQELPQGDPVLRAELQALLLPELIERLQALDPAAVEMVDVVNRRRVERALEIVILTGKPLGASRKESQGSTPTPRGVGVMALLLTRDREELNARIEANVQTMFQQGVEAEVAALPEQHVGPTASMTLGLREIRSLLRNEITQEEAIAAISSATRRYAKRQMTWFSHQHDFPKLNLSLFSDPEKSLVEALRLLKAPGPQHGSGILI